MKKLFTKLMAVMAILLLCVWNVNAASYIPTVTRTFTANTTVYSTDVDLSGAPTSPNATSWVVIPSNSVSSTTYTNTNGDSNGNPTSITDNLTSASSINMIQIKADGGVYNSVKRVIHMRVTGITGFIAHGYTGSAARGMQVSANLASGLTETSAMNVVASVTRSNTGGSFIASYNSLNASETYVLSVYALSGDTRFYAIEFITPAAPTITAFTAAGVTATINQTAKTITAELPYGTNLTAITPSVTIGGTATSYSPTGAQDFSGGVVNYVATDGTLANDVTYAVTLTASAIASSEKELSAVTIGGLTPVYDAGTKTYSIILPKASSLTQAVAFTKPITATANFTSGNTHDFTSPLDITVTAQDNSTEIYHLQAVVGTKNIAYVTGSGNVDPYLRGSLVAKGYYVEDVIAASQTASYFANHDLAILFDVVSSSNTLAQNMKDLIGTKRFLNLKAFMYGKTGWPTGTGANVAASKVATVASNYISHPIFTGLTFDNANITLVDAGVTGNGIQGVTTPGSGTSIATMLDNTAASCIIEDNTVENAMYLMVGIANGTTAGLAYISADGKKLLDNSVAYLLGDTKYVPTTTALTPTNLNGISFDGKMLRNPNSELVHVFDATGRLVVSSTKDVVLSSTAKGIYFVKSNSGNLKIALNK